MGDHTSVIVASIPDCDICKEDGITRPAYADACLVTGQWGNVCVEHFNMYGKGLGLGRGQRLMTEESVADRQKRTLSEPVEAADEDDDYVDPEVDLPPFYSREHEAAAKYLADLIKKRDLADKKIPLTEAERTSWNKRIAKASIIMNTNAMKAKGQR